MSEKQMEMAGAATGIAAVVLLLVSSFMVPTEPKLDDSAVSVEAFFSDHASVVRASAYVGGAALALFLWFLGTLRAHLAKVEGGGGRLTAVVFGAGIATIAVFIVALALSVVITLDPGGVGPTGTRLLYQASIEISPASSFLIGPLVGALALIILRHGGLPRWLGMYSAVFAVYEVVEGLCVTGTSGAFAPQGAINLAGLFIFAVWGLLTSGTLVRTIATRAG